MSTNLLMFQLCLNQVLWLHIATTYAEYKARKTKAYNKVLATGEGIRKNTWIKLIPEAVKIGVGYRVFYFTKIKNNKKIWVFSWI